ncbi:MULTISPECIES: serine hydrolase domain-containing protein [unclassified Micromonospora]|uniref:serine hydrolase domain-containing protein n=1 Tax=unclassified Micromonospora TaxID=2617518 RepID=UPI00188DD743|nr:MULTISPECIES: serine hydrolase domain-containing protein [unclassified Micromonospora]MBF5029555.1 beta-lactamase family protein [Micromonospora sp. ANENR4]WBC04388.1 serine hydrolase [Micromonospora sp. WMMA1976]
MSTPSLEHGVLLLTRGDDHVVDRVAGVADEASGRRCTAATRFQIASISKQMAAVAVLLLAERGALSLSDPVVRRLPGTPPPQWSGITLHHLLTHTSGLGHWEDYPAIDLHGPAEPDELLDRFAALPPLFRPGTAWHYSSPGYVLLARTVERVADRPYADFLAEEVFAPLGMTRSFAGSGDGRADVAIGHEGGRPVPSWDLTTVSLGAGDVWSTGADLLTWLDVPRRGRLLGAASVAAMTAPHAPTGRPDEAYGYGFFVGPLAGRRALHHSGDNGGYKAFAAWLPDTDQRLVLLTNRAEVDPRTITSALDAV